MIATLLLFLAAPVFAGVGGPASYSSPGVGASVSASTLTATQCLRTDANGSDFLAGPGCGADFPRGVTAREVQVGTGPVKSTFTQDGNVIIPGYLRADGGATFVGGGSSVTIKTMSSASPALELNMDSGTSRWSINQSAAFQFVITDVTNGISNMIFNQTAAGSGVTYLNHAGGNLGVAVAANEAVAARVHISSGTRSLLINGNAPEAMRIGTSSAIITSDRFRLNLPFDTSSTVVHGTSVTFQSTVRLHDDLNLSTGSVFMKLDEAGQGMYIRFDGADPSAGTYGANEPFLIQRNGDTADHLILALLAGNAAVSGVNFGDAEDKGAGYIRYDHATNALAFAANGSEKSRIDSNGDLGVGTADPKARVHASSGPVFNDGSAAEIYSTGGIRAGQYTLFTTTLSATVGILAGTSSTQTIAGGNTVAADSCGGIKKISAASAVATDTTNTFTAPAVGNHGCCMEVINIGSVHAITLDANTNFKTVSAADVILTADDAVRVCSDGVVWRQITTISAL